MIVMMGRVMSVIMLVPLGVASLSAGITGLLLTQLTIGIVLTTCGSLLILVAFGCLSNSTLRSISLHGIVGRCLRQMSIRTPKSIGSQTSLATLDNVTQQLAKRPY